MCLDFVEALKINKAKTAKRARYPTVELSNGILFHSIGRLR